MNGWGEVAGRGLVVIGIAALATAVMTLVLIGVCVLLEHWWPLGEGIDLDEMDRPAIYHTDAALDEQAARDIRNALRDLARREGRSSPL